MNLRGEHPEYDSASLYYGLHLGAGHIWKLNHKTSFDLYGKYFYTHQRGDETYLSTGEQLSFEAIDSNRIRLGGRYSYQINELTQLYTGLAWEYEFDGKARATTNGYAIAAPELKGSTGIGELGLSLKPSPASPMTIDLNLHGYFGKREGVSGSLQLNWNF